MSEGLATAPDGEGEEEKDGEEERESEDPLLDLVMSDIMGLGEEPVQSLEEVLRETEYLDTSGLNDYDSLSSLPGVGLATGLPSTPQHRNVSNLAIPAGGIDSDIGDTLSVQSWGSKSGKSFTSRKSRDGSSQTRQEFGSIMRHVILKAVSSQICSAIERVNSGAPTCMATTHLIAVGTQGGFVLVFDSCQVIKWFLGGLDLGSNYGAVSSLAFNSDSTRLKKMEKVGLPPIALCRLLAGFARGQLVEWDITTGKLLRDLADLHPPGSGILTTRYTDDPNFAFFADSGGSVFEVRLSKWRPLQHFVKVNMKRGLRGPGASARCIFSGSRGEVCTLEPLKVGAYPGHPLGHHSILALATISKVIVITVRPRLKVLMTAPLTGDPATLPLLSWQFVVIQNPSFNKVVDPVLTFARERTIHFYQVTVNLSDRIVFIPLQSITLDFPLLSLQWLNTRCLGVVDTSEHFHLLDVRTKERLETLDLTGVQIVYQTQFFKGAATGGNVSAALSLGGEMAVYGSNTSFTNQLLLLGNRTYHVLMIRTWSERLDHLLKNNSWVAAMQLGAEFYSEPGRALVGLRGGKDRKRSHISLKLVGILKKFLDISMTKNFPTEGGMGTLTKYFNEIVPPCVDLCVKLGKQDLLFEGVWSTFQEDPFSRAVYLEALEPFILSDQLSELPPAIGQEFVSHYALRGKLEALEACVTHLSVACIDIHQVMSLCQQHNLFDAIIHIYNKAMLDYITPAEKLLVILSTCLASPPLTEQQVKLGNKLLVYISCCLAGRAYPWGDVPKDQVKQVKYDVYSTITALHSRSIGENPEPPYPHLHTLLHFDTQGFLNVISIAFEEEEFQTEVGKCQRQRLVDILLEVMVKEESPFSASQVGLLFTFLARQLSKGEGVLAVSRELFSKVLGVLTKEEEQGSKEERQQALLDMITAGGWEYFDMEVLRQDCERVGFHRVLERMWEKEGMKEKILECYLRDEMRTSQAFSFLQNVFTDASQSPETKDIIRNQFKAAVKQLAKVDVKKTAGMLVTHAKDAVEQVIGELEVKQRFALLGAVVECKENASAPSTPVHGQGEEKKEYLNSPNLYRDYVGLMLQLDPGMVAGYLRSRPDCCPASDLLDLARQYKVKEVEVLLLEREGRVNEAFDLITSGLQRQIETLSSGAVEEPLQWTSLNTALIVAVTFCQRVSPTLTKVEDREALWLPLLDIVSKPLTAVQDKKKEGKWRELVRHVVSSMLGHVSHTRVLEAVLADPGANETSNWSELRRLLGEIIDTFRYESQLLESSRQVVHEERAALVRRLVGKRLRGLSCTLTKCSSCGQPFKGTSRVAVFPCKHAFHTACLDRAGGLTLSPIGEEVWRCSLCCPCTGTVDRPGIGEKSKGERDLKVGEELKDIKEKNSKEKEEVSEEVVQARQFLQLYSRGEAESSSHIFGETSYVKSNKFPLKLRPGTLENL